jgi:hypothetical protein
MYQHQPATSPAAGHRDARRPNAKPARTAAAVSRLSTAMNLRPILRRAAVAAAGTGAVAALALGPSTPSFAAARTTVVTATNQAGYLVGGNNWNFQVVQGVRNCP